MSVCIGARCTEDPAFAIVILMFAMFGLALLFVPIKIQSRRDAGAYLVRELFGPKVAWVYGSVFYRVLGAVFLALAIYLLITY